MQRKFSSYIIYAILIVSSASCATKEKETTEKWSLKMADAVMERYDSLYQYNGRTRAGWSYDVALLGGAIDKLGTVDDKYADYFEAYVDMQVDDSGQVARYKMETYNVDMIRPASSLITLYKRTGNEKFKKAIPQFITQMENHPVTKTGGYWHKKRYPYQMWLDGIFMAEPFLAEYAKEYNQPGWFDHIALQISLIYDKTHDPKTGLLYHAWDESKEQRWSNPETGQSPHFWSRAMGWYVMAIVDVLDYFPEDHPNRVEIIEILQNTCDALLKVQDPKSGVWYQVLDMGGKEGNYLEGSGSAMYTYAFAKGAKKGYLNKKYLNIANKAFDNVVKTFIITDEDGLPSMVQICGSCGLGGNPYRDGSYEYYITEKIVKNDCKGVGPFILAAWELNR